MRFTCPEIIAVLFHISFTENSVSSEFIITIKHVPIEYANMSL